MRITKAQLAARLEELNRLLGRPDKMFSEDHGTRTSIGHIALDKNAGGYLLEEQTTTAGSVRTLSDRMTAGEMGRHLTSMICGIRLSQRQASASGS